MRARTKWGGLMMLALAVTTTGCASMQTTGGTTSTTSPSLYRRLGGREGIRGVVDGFVANLVADPRVSGRFKALQPADVERVKTNMSDQICEATGGPCTYLGKDMKTTHKGMNVTEAEWAATVENLGKALDARKVAAEDKQQLLGLLTPMKKDVVGQ